MAKTSAKKKEATEVVKAATTAVSTDLASEMLADAGRGNENLDSKDFIIPFMKIVQPLSNVKKKTHENYMAEAEDGMIYNTATKEFYTADEGIIIVSVAYARHYIEWDSPDGNGKFVTDHGTDDGVLNQCDVNDKGQHITPDNHVIYETGMNYVLIVDPADGSFRQAIIATDRTQLKPAKQLNELSARKTIVDGEGKKHAAPRFAYAYRLNTKMRSNEFGEWYTWNPTDYGIITDLPNGSEIYAAAKQFNSNISKGNVKTADHESEGGSKTNAF